VRHMRRRHVYYLLVSTAEGIAPCCYLHYLPYRASHTPCHKRLAGGVSRSKHKGGKEAPTGAAGLCACPRCVLWGCSTTSAVPEWRSRHSMWVAFTWHSIPRLDNIVSSVKVGCVWGCSVVPCCLCMLTGYINPLFHFLILLAGHNALVAYVYLAHPQQVAYYVPMVSCKLGEGHGAGTNACVFAFVSGIYCWLCL
jgi:hypothetical protein